MVQSASPRMAVSLVPVIWGRAGGAVGRERAKTNARQRETLRVQRQAEIPYGTGHTAEIRCAARIVGKWDDPFEPPSQGGSVGSNPIGATSQNPLRCKGFWLVLRVAGISLGESSGRVDLLRALYEQLREFGVISDDNVDMAWTQVWTLSSQPLSPEVRQWLEERAGEWQASAAAHHSLLATQYSELDTMTATEYLRLTTMPLSVISPDPPRFGAGSD
jgi:hypothetical protein